jgi:hypothetical protein
MSVIWWLLEEVVVPGPLMEAAVEAEAQEDI